MNKRMDEWRGYCLNNSGIDPIHPDGVHPNCWGQWLMVREIFQAMGYPDLRTMKIDSVVKLAWENWKALGYGTKDKSWTPDRSTLYIRRLLRQA
jgi:hypothetical protein